MTKTRSASWYLAAQSRCCAAERLGHPCTRGSSASSSGCPRRAPNRDVFDALHQRDQRVAITAPTGAQNQRHSCRRRAWSHHGPPTAKIGIPGQLTIVVGVQIDKARRDPGAFSIDYALGRFAAQITDGCDVLTANRDIGPTPSRGLLPSTTSPPRIRMSCGMALTIAYRPLGDGGLGAMSPLPR